ncbi:MULTISPECIES: putative DNA modification/repair radical SAM protein [unclassified Mucilaginibacter]|uniref:putative DNA modification/repair radical SAM protein n=1 Tax=unclassified Mucilaginibacter TaxID=2617802 RepID=UPI002AC9C3BC|nr:MULTISPECIES: putative DNA modification/repair radical SAM protein [unclassified Mucilaginibacter]MEB0260820.1 putative DNA modification/repair radical SAM protein [Mucilaginibacter sp. 10I4]MEB0279035.1 putative DNA modification/repair radical SAM protein [Mucilaginibacter sp. 10B2]MEB0299946.1 putative DNA modification/repair radical SAM protein [Mucilaginibacter sp. 5C4]WPX22213.1 putative DNA modification/repair radical SAM protein [Mucilaginibacter sp. 5C4]
MNVERITEKLNILADAAKYDVSCASSGSKRKNENKGLGNASNGICHSYTEDGRCVSLLKILLTNHCIFDCAYCVSRKNNDIQRAAFTVQEVVDLTINFYRRNYIEGLFLSSGIFKDADYTMERLVRIAKKLRTEHKFNGYIHLKSIPGASDELMNEAGLYADRLSVNLEMPTEAGLKLLAPDKNQADMIKPMGYLRNAIIQRTEEKKLFKKAPIFAPAGQSTQVIIGATPENDNEVLRSANYFYKNFNLKRVYYSGYVPVLADSRLPALNTSVPMVRENRLYQADWLMRFYGFKVNEIVNDSQPHLDLDIDPKLGWAIRNMQAFPVNINKADLQMILRVPGIGLLSAQKIVSARKFGKLNWDQLKKMGVALNRAKYFVTCNSNEFERRDLTGSNIKQFILATSQSKYLKNTQVQLSLF